MALVEVKVPDIGDFKEVGVIELLVKPGDTVKAEQSLITVESDKASMEIPSSHAGVVKELKVALGDKVSEGSVVLMLEVAGVSPSPLPSPIQEEGATPVAAPAVAAVAVPPSALAGEGAPVNVFVPDIGDFKDVAVIEILVKVGDTVKAEQSLITVESDKASMEIPSSAAGVVKELKVALGDKVSQGSLVLVLEGAAGASPSPQPSPIKGEGATPAATPAAAAVSPSPLVGEGRGEGGAPLPAHNPVVAPSASLPHASPSIRKLARELGVPLAEVKGSGLKGRITQADVQGFVKGVMAGDVQTTAQKAKAPAPVAAVAAAVPVGGGIPGLLPWPKVDFAKFGDIETKPLSRIKKI